MIVCSCNVFSDLEVRAAFSMADRPTMAQVYRHLGHEPTCGRCVHTIREMMGDDKTKASFAMKW
jgi:bacterioferritin-associated ferredoxin